MSAATETAAPACLTCQGEGTLRYPVCHHAYECGSGCGGSICGDVDAPCERCEGTGVEPCADCGDPSALVLFGDAICVRCYEKEIG